MRHASSQADTPAILRLSPHSSHPWLGSPSEGLVTLTDSWEGMAPCHVSAAQMKLDGFEI